MIDRDTLIKLAREADAAHDSVQVTPFLERFAALIAAEVGIAQWHRGFAEGQAVEREACAKVCEEQAMRSETSMEKSKTVKARDIYSSAGQTAHWMAAAIRARSTHDSAAGNH